MAILMIRMAVFLMRIIRKRTYPYADRYIISKVQALRKQVWLLYARAERMDVFIDVALQLHM